MPVIRPFRALRFSTEQVSDLGAVVSPPYDVVDTGQHAELLARHPRNVIRLELPPVEPGEDPDERYRRAARTLAEWRSDGTLRKDSRAAVYVYEQAYRVPGTDVERTQRGFFGRLRLEPLETGSGVRPHERTLAAPREDRYRLLRATGVNTSPVVALYDDPSGSADAILDEIAALAPTAELLDAEGVRHRLWVAPAEGELGGRVEALLAAAGERPVTIADGHHRYETALRYRDERRMSRSCEEDPAFDYLLVLFLPADNDALTVLPTHRVVRGLGEDGVASLWERLGELFAIEGPLDAPTLEREFGSGAQPGGAGVFGLWTRGRGARLVARREAFAPFLPSGAGDSLRGLDVSLLGAALERLAGIDAAAAAGGERIRYTKSAAEGIALVDGGTDGADAAFLLQPTPVRAIVDTAAEGDVMPQKSTYFYPKALTGLVINPHEW